MATELPIDPPVSVADPFLGSAPLPEREALLRAILETSPDGLVTIDEYWPEAPTRTN